MRKFIVFCLLHVILALDINPIVHLIPSSTDEKNTTTNTINSGTIIIHKELFSPLASLKTVHPKHPKPPVNETILFPVNGTILANDTLSSYDETNPDENSGEDSPSVFKGVAVFYITVPFAAGKIYSITY